MSRSQIDEYCAQYKGMRSRSIQGEGEPVLTCEEVVAEKLLKYYQTQLQKEMELLSTLSKVFGTPQIS